MALLRLAWASGLLAAFLAFPFESFAFDTPLSDTAIREAYFMGQRRSTHQHRQSAWIGA
jgi:hypothetical protein